MMKNQHFPNHRLFLAALGFTLLFCAEGVQAAVKLEASMGDTIILANQPQKGYVRVALTGESPDSVAMEKQRATVNMALVLDRSGSMQGEKLQRVKEAAKIALARLEPNDIVALVAYDDTIDVLVPATKLGNGDSFRMAIESLVPRNNTALYDGVQQGAAEVRKFKQEAYMNRILLLSDGLANVGPKTAEELGTCGSCLLNEGISVSTIGVGLDFNEDLMTRLAASSDGNHLFAERPEDIMKAFKDEFEDVTTVVAKNLGITITFDPRIHPKRALGREVVLNGQTVYAGLNQLYSGQTKYVLLEVEIDSLTPNEAFQGANVHIDYADPLSGGPKTADTHAALRITDSRQIAMQGENRDVMECVVAQLAVESNERAMQLRDNGQVQQSQQVLQQNAQWLEQQAQTYNSEALEKLGKDNRTQAESVVDNNKWQGLRKSMSKGQFDVKRQTGKN